MTWDMVKMIMAYIYIYMHLQIAFTEKCVLEELAF